MLKGYLRIFTSITVITTALMGIAIQFNSTENTTLSKEAFAKEMKETNPNNAPSDWALAELNAAKKEDLIPQKLKINYLEPITRAEFVGLAMQVYKKGHADFSSQQNASFSDINDSIYKNEIIAATELGIVQGISADSFQPEKTLTIEQAAVIIVNLIHVMFPNEAITVRDLDYEFVDEREISTWALHDVLYCFENNIINGIPFKGSIKMLPKQEISQEKAIILLYRLSSYKGLISSSGEVEHTESTASQTFKEMFPKLKQNKVIGIEHFNDFQASFGKVAANAVSEIVKKYDFHSITISPREMELALSPDDSMILLKMDAGKQTMVVETSNIEDYYFEKSFLHLVKTFENQTEIQSAFQSLQSFISNNQQETINKQHDSGFIFGNVSLRDGQQSQIHLTVNERKY